MPVSEIGLMPMPESGPDALAHLALDELDHLFGLRCATRPLDAGVDVLGVLPEDDDVHQLRMRDGRGRAGEVADRPHAGIEIEHLPQRDVEAADAAAHRRRQRPLDRDLVGADGFERVVRQPLAVLFLGLLAGGHLEPMNPPGAPERLFHRRIEHAHAGTPDVGAGAVAFDERDDRIVGNDEASVLAGDRGAFGRSFQDAECWHGSQLGQLPSLDRLFRNASTKTVENFVEITAVGRVRACQIRAHSVLHHDGAPAPAPASPAAAAAHSRRLSRTTREVRKNIAPAPVNDIPPR